MIKKSALWLNLITLLIGSINVYAFFSLYSIWEIINEQVPIPFIPITIIFSILVTTVFLATIAAILKSINMIHLKSKKSRIIASLLLLLLTLVLSAIIAYIFFEMGGSRNRILENMYDELTYAISLLPFIIIIFLVILSPRLKVLQNKLLKGFAVITILLIMILLSLKDLGGIKITYGPSIQVVDDSTLAVIWTTNKKSTEYVEYGTDEDNLKSISASKHGLVNANSFVHKVLIPVEGMEKLVYRVGSRQIKHLYDGEVVYGNTVVSDLKTVNNFSNKDEVSFYVLNDVHELNNIYKQFLDNKDYNFAVLNGDMMNTVKSPVSFSKKILQPITLSTKGEKPFVFVRGNHEMRGAAARELSNFLALPEDRFYYTFTAGPLFAVVLDLGEDKADDDKFNYGLTAFNEYKEEETKWLKEVCESQEYRNAKYRIAFIHIPLNSNDSNSNETYKDNYKEEWRELFNSTGMDMIFSGHTHIPQVIEPDQEKFNFPTVIGGGDHDEASFIAVRAVATPKELKVFYVKYDGSEEEIYRIDKTNK